MAICEFELEIIDVNYKNDALSNARVYILDYLKKDNIIIGLK